MGAFTKVSHWSHGFQVKVLYLDDSVQIHNRMESYHKHKVAATPGQAPHLSYLPELVQVVIQKSSFVYWTLSWIGISRLRWFSSEGNYKDKHSGRSLCFQRIRFLLEKTCKILLSHLFNICSDITKAVFICITLTVYKALSHSFVPFCFQDRLPTSVVAMLTIKHTLLFLAFSSWELEATKGRSC